MPDTDCTARLRVLTARLHLALPEDRDELRREIDVVLDRMNADDKARLP